MAHKEGRRGKIFSRFYCNTCKSRKNGLPHRSFPVLVETGGRKTGPLQTGIRLVSWGQLPWMGVMSVGVCEGSACHHPVSFQPWWPLPHRHQRGADVICSHSAVTWRNGNQRPATKGGEGRGGREVVVVGKTARMWVIWSAHVFIYLTLWTCKTCRRPSLPFLLPYSHPSSSSRQH